MNNMLQQYEHIVGMMGEISYHLPDVLASFDEMRLATMLESTLEKKDKNLIGIGLAVATGGEGWVEHFVIHALQSGATQQEIIEMIGVAILMGGASIIKYGCAAYETMLEYEMRDRAYRREIVQDSADAVIQQASIEAGLIAAR